MKQKLLFLLVTLAFLLPARLSAYDFESGGIYYDLGESQDDSGNPIYIASVVESPNDNKYSGDIIIPSTIEYDGLTYTVMSIKVNAFNGCSDMTSVEIGDSVNEIGACAFFGCSGLTSVEIGDSVNEIGDCAFSGCSGLTSVEIPNSVTSIGGGAFDGCSGLTSVVIPPSVTSIGYVAFNGCFGLIKSAYPNNLENPFNFGTAVPYNPEGAIIEDGWIWESGKKEIRFVPLNFEGEYSIPETVTSIGDYAFSGCNGLTFVNIPNSVTTIGNYAFSVTGLTSLKIPNSVTSIGDGAFINCTGLTSLNIPNSVTSIGNHAFESCFYLKSVVLPRSVISIGDRAFYDCSHIGCFVICSPDITLGSEIIGGLCSENMLIFAPQTLDCSSLGYNVLPIDPENKISLLEDGTVLADNGKTLIFVPLYENMSYTIPEGVTKICASAFSTSLYIGGFHWALTSLTIPSSIEEIEPDVFHIVNIEKVNFTDWTKWYANIKLGNLYANPYWKSKPYVGGVQMVTPELPDGITEIPDYINYGLQFKDEIELPRSIKRIGAYAFYNNKELFSVILPAGLEEIGESAFEGCTLLENPSFPAGLKKIEDAAYKGCESITEIVLPEGLSTLGSRPSGIEESNEIEAKGVFEGCSSLEKAVVAVDIDYLADNIFKRCTALDKIYFPLQLKVIGNCAFEQCSTLEEITFPASLESIGEKAFFGSDGSELMERGSISRLVIPDGVKRIGKKAFAYQSIVNLSIGSGLDCIPDGAFRGNESLNVIKFSEGLKEIDSYAFANCGNIGSVILPSTVSHIGANAFEEVYISNLVIPDKVEILPKKSCGIPSTLTLGSMIKDIAADAFDFKNLYTIRLKAHMPPTLTDAFPLTSQQNDQLTLIVNKGRHDTYNTNARWKQIDRILEEGDTEIEVYLDGTYSLAEEIRIQSGLMPSCVTKMMVDGPLSDNDLRVIKENMISLTSLDLSNVTNLTALPAGQFEGSLLTNVVLPSNLESIGEYAFKDCRLLELTELPASVKTIGREAFRSCPSVNLTALPAALENIEEYAFSGTGMFEIVGGDFLQEVEPYAFQDCKLLERVDLSATPLTVIADYVFEGCHELDEVILPSSVDNIGRYAFSGTALRNIDFAAGVTNIGDYAFSDNRRLVSATLPESLTEVGSNLFASCPRLISLSMPQGTTSVGANVVKNDRKLANLSCSAPGSPEAATGAFDDVRFRYVTLTIPTLSFRDYLSAPQWGKFESTQNRIKISINKGVSVTSAAEKEYQDMLTEDALEAAQDAAAAQNGKMSSARKMRRAAARANTTQNFASLFDGAQLMPGKEGGVNRVFITPKEGVNVTSILFDGEELIESFDGQSILLPEGKSGELEILTDAKPVLAESILLSDKELSLTASETAKLTATVGPDDADDKTVTWTSSDESIAIVDENGEVTVTGVGNVMIIASCGEVTSECALKCYPQPGDANWNGNVTIADAVDISNFVVKKKTAPEEWDEEEWMEFYSVGANANGSEDGEITFADATAAVRIALANPVAASMQNRIGASYGKFNETADALVMAASGESNDGKASVAVKLDNSMEYVALQADIFIPDGMDIEVKAGSRAANHALETMRFDENHLRVALFDLGNKAFSAGDDPILEIVAEGNISDIENLAISNILAADSDANEYLLGSRMGSMTGVEGVSNGAVLIERVSGGIQVSNAAGKRIDIFTMDGQAVRSFVANGTIETINLPAGIYIVKAGDKNLKVIL